MAGPPNPFMGPSASQRGAAANPTGRGRGGSTGKPTPYQPKTTSATRGSSSLRARGRGATAATRAGRGKGPNSMTWVASNAQRKTDGTGAASTATPSSPFSQLQQGKAFTSSFGGQPAHAGSPFGNGANQASTFGAPSTLGNMVDATRDPRRRSAARNPTHVQSAASVPVENASVINTYHTRYEQLKIDRAKQREKAIREGQMADPNQPTSLNQAITPVGTCTSMCPEFERVERIVQKMVDKSEKFLHPRTDTLQNMESKMLKRFRRSAAGYDEQLPSDIRTPKTLLQATNYLIRHIIGGPEPLGTIHKFVWDRTRSIRNDFSVQQVTQENDVKIAVTCLERIARFHIVSLHLLSSPANEQPFDHHQEREQLNNTMLSLMYYYDDNRGQITFPNEDEFRAYYIIFSIHDQRPDLEARVQKWPAELRSSPRVQAALEIFAAAGNTWEYQGTLDAKRPNAIAQGFYSRFFSLVDSPSVSYLMACVAEIYFNHMRQTAIRSIWKAYCRFPQSQQHKNEEWTISELTEILHFDDESQTIAFCEDQDLQLTENASGELYLNWGDRLVDSVAFQPSSAHAFSERYVEVKRSGRTLAAIILGLNIKEAADAGMVDRDLLAVRDDLQPSLTQPNPAGDESLFVSDDENETQAPVVDMVDSTAAAPTLPESQHQQIFDKSRTSGQCPFGEVSQLQSAQDQPNGFSQPAVAKEPHEPAQTFSSLFAPANPLTSANTSLATSSPPASGPTFSSLFAAKGLTTGEASSPFPTFSPSPSPHPQPSMFTTGSNPFQPASTAAPSLTLSQPTMPSFTFANTNQTFSTSSTSLFNHAPEPSDTKLVPVSDALADQQFTDPPKPVNSLPTSGPFDFVHPTPPPTEPVPPAETPATGPNVLAEQSIFTTQEPPVPNSNGILAHKPATQPSAPSTMSPVQEPEANPTARVGVAHSVFSHSTAAAVAMTSIPAQNHLMDAAEHVPQPAKPVAPGAFSMADSKAEPVEPKVQPLETTDVTPRVIEEPFTLEDSVNDHVKDERRLAWLETLKGTAVRRRQDVTIGRKRQLEESHEEQVSRPETSAKAVKSAIPDNAFEKPKPTKRSLALASLKPLPTLPILEQVKSMIASKPATTPEPQPARKSQIDEDELLLSAARIAAESLRSGPKLLDYPHAYPDPRRSSFSPRSSFSSSLGLSRAHSPPQSRVNGYEVAFAPDTPLEFGRTMSRTEQRIRLTGGKGLAYKPLNLTPKKETKAKSN